MERAFVDALLNKVVKIKFKAGFTREGILERSDHYEGHYKIGGLHFSKDCIATAETKIEP